MEPSPHPLPLPPAVSIIVPAYNQANWIEDTLRSVESQTHRNFECIVVNDGSLDDTGSIVDEFVRRDSRFRLIHQTNGGVSSARNRGLDAASGDHVLFLDGDDLLLPNKLSHELTLLRNESADICFGSVRSDWIRDPTHPLNGRIWSAPKEIGDKFSDFLGGWEVDFVLPIMGFIVRRELLVKSGARWNPALYSHEDWDFWLQVMSSRTRFVTSNEVTAVYRVHTSGATANRYRCWLGYLTSWKIQQKRYGHIPIVSQALIDHRRRMHAIYKQSFPFRSWLAHAIVRREWFRNNCPWPIQAMLRQFCGV